MLKSARTALGLAAAAGIIASCTSEGDKPAKTAEPAPAAQHTAPLSEPPLTVERSAQARVTARVKTINYATREITLQDTSGHTESLIAGPQVQRLNEVHAGDDVAVDYVVSLVAELRPPTAEESASPISAVEVAGRSPKGSDPAAGVARGAKVVTTVEAVDLANMAVRLKGPLGDTMTVRARNAENVKKLHVGDTIVITYVEAMAVSLVKATR